MRLVLLSLISVVPAFSSACITQSLANYVSLGATGCTINGELVDNFSFSVVATTLGSPLTSSAITVTPTFTASEFRLAFAATGGTTATAFMVTGTDSAKYEIDWTWDPVVIGAEDDMNTNTPVFPGTATINSFLCAGQAFGGATCPTRAAATNTLTLFSNGNMPAPVFTTFSPVLVVGSINVIDLEANGASSQIRGFQQAVVTPEPATCLSMLAGVALLLRTRRQRLQAFA